LCDVNEMFSVISLRKVAVFVIGNEGCFISGDGGCDTGFEVLYQSCTNIVTW
jgi:hypothetical protein